MIQNIRNAKLSAYGQDFVVTHSYPNLDTDTCKLIISELAKQIQKFQHIYDAHDPADVEMDPAGVVAFLSNPKNWKRELKQRLYCEDLCNEILDLSKKRYHRVFRHKGWAICEISELTDTTILFSFECD